MLSSNPTARRGLLDRTIKDTEGAVWRLWEVEPTPGLFGTSMCIVVFVSERRDATYRPCLARLSVSITTVGGWDRRRISGRVGSDLGAPSGSRGQIAVATAVELGLVSS